MKVLSKDDAAGLLRTDALDNFVRQRVDQLRPAGAAFTIPQHAGAKTALAKFLATLLLRQPQVCVYLTGWNLNPTSEHLDLLYGYRRSAGEMRYLAEAPLHVFDPAAGDALISILCLVFYFALDAWVFDVEGKTMIRISNGCIEVRAGEQHDMADFAADPGKYLNIMMSLAA